MARLLCVLVAVVAFRAEADGENALRVLELNRNLTMAITQCDRTLESAEHSGLRCYEMGKTSAYVEAAFASAGRLFSPTGDPVLNRKLLPMNEALKKAAELAMDCEGPQPFRVGGVRVKQVRGVLERVRASLEPEVQQAIFHLHPD